MLVWSLSFYSEGALGELNPTLKTVLDILKGISSVRVGDV